MGLEAWEALAHVRQALQFLVLDHKGSLTLEDITQHICPALNHQQLYRLCTTAWDEAPSGEGELVSAVVTWDDGRDYGAGVPVPAALVDDGCPTQVFSFLEARQSWPWADQRPV
eukprot:gene6794-7011_t